MTPIEAGVKIRTKKPHACGGDCWQVLRTGADIKIKCLNCGRIIMFDRSDFDKRLRTVLKEGNQNER